MSLRKNVIANYLGQGWTALMGLAFIPLYIKYLGIEAYGLIGLFAVLQAWLSLLDMGMAPALSREMARFTGGAHNAQSIRDLLRSIEIIGFGIAILVALGVWAASGWLASGWLEADQLPVDAIAKAFSIMGIVTALRFIENIYRSSIVGLQKQVLLNVVTSLMATLRGFGAVGVLVWVAPTIEAFFVWQGLVSVVTVGFFSMAVYRAIPEAHRAGQFSASALKGVWQFAGGMIVITFLSLLLMQMDKLLLSKLLTLSEFGYYSFATVITSALYMLVSPIAQAFYPRFCEQIARGDKAGLIEAYHKSARLVTILAGSAAVVLIYFGEVILRFWTQDAELATKLSPLVAVLSLGTLLNGLMWVPYQTQLAHGWTSLTVKTNVISVSVLIPALLWVTPRYGAIGAAWIWVALNVAYILIGIHFMYRRLLTKERWRWYKQDIGAPLLVGFAIACLLSNLIPYGGTVLGNQIFLGVSIMLTMMIAMAVVGEALQKSRPTTEPGQ